MYYYTNVVQKEISVTVNHQDYTILKELIKEYTDTFIPYRVYDDMIYTSDILSVVCTVDSPAFTFVFRKEDILDVYTMLMGLSVARNNVARITTAYRVASLLTSVVRRLDYFEQED